MNARPFILGIENIKYNKFTQPDDNSNDVKRTFFTNQSIFLLYARCHLIWSVCVCVFPIVAFTLKTKMRLYIPFIDGKQRQNRRK